MLLAKVAAGRLEAALSVLQGHRLAAAAGRRDGPALFCCSHGHSLCRLWGLLGHQELVPPGHQGNRLFSCSEGRVSHLFWVWVTRLDGGAQKILPEIALFVYAGARPEGGLLRQQPRGHILRDELLVSHCFRVCNTRALAPCP